jgi:hypothetical protein
MMLIAQYCEKSFLLPPPFLLREYNAKIKEVEMIAGWMDGWIELFESEETI